MINRYESYELTVTLGFLCYNTHDAIVFSFYKMAATRVRNFEALLKFKIKSPERRKNLYKNLITALVQHERIETTLCRCQDMSRVAERVR